MKQRNHKIFDTYIEARNIMASNQKQEAGTAGESFLCKILCRPVYNMMCSVQLTWFKKRSKFPLNDWLHLCLHSNYKHKCLLKSLLAGELAHFVV